MPNSRREVYLQRKLTDERTRMRPGSTTVGFVRSLEQKVLEFIVSYIIGKMLDKAEPTFRTLIKKLNVRFPLGVGAVTVSVLQLLGYLPYTGWLNSSPIVKEFWFFVVTIGGILA